MARWAGRLAVLGSLACAALNVDAALAQCGAPLAPEIEVRVTEPPAAYRLAAPSDALSAAAERAGTALGRGKRLLGFTLNRYERQILIVTEAAGGGCFRLRSASLAMGAYPEVLVDGRFARGTCQQDAILAHENEHVAVFRDAVLHYAPMIDAGLREALPSSIRVATEEGARTAYVRIVRAAVEPWLDAIRRRAQDGNDRLDTPENYVRVFRRCPSW